MTYSHEDDIRHFEYLLPAFRDERYIRVDGKPLFAIYTPEALPNARAFIDLWQQMAQKAGLPGIHFVGYTANSRGRSVNGKISLWATDQASKFYKNVLDMGFDAVNSAGLFRAESMCHGKWGMLRYYISKNTFLPTSNHTEYSRIMKHYYVPEDAWENVYPTLFPQWDRSPRAGAKTNIIYGSTPEKFEKSLYEAFKLLQGRPAEHCIAFLKSWNEWGEGNYVEPDLKFGHGYINAIRRAIENQK